MKVAFFVSEQDREINLARSFGNGVVSHGDAFQSFDISEYFRVIREVDIACMVGVKSARMWKSSTQFGVIPIIFDKGYQRQIDPSSETRTWEFWRVSVGSHNPTKYLMTMGKSYDRARDMCSYLNDWRKRGSHIVVAGSSEKYHQFYGLPHPTEYAEKIIRRLRAISPHREIVYRPKPTWKGASPIQGSRFSGRDESMKDVLRGAHALVTHGSNACFDAICAGIPCVVLGDGVAKPISRTAIEDIEDLKMVRIGERWQWLANLAYCEWKLSEFSSGEAWRHIRPLIGLPE